MKLVLASGSPRRRELLRLFTEDFIVDPATGPEIPPESADPARIVMTLSAAKAEEVAARHPGCTVLGADTVVEADGVILGKPADGAEAFRMLRRLSGREHRVYTGVTLSTGDRVLTESECTRVFFRPLTDEEIAHYIATGEPLDKAGAYGYQGRASLFVERIEGDYFNVVGLPLCRLGEMLKKTGVTLL